MEIVGLVVLYFLGSFVFVGFFFVTSSSRRGERLDRSWGAYAARQGYRFVRGKTPERPFVITGSRDGLDFVLEVDARDAVVTRLTARASRSAAGRVVAAAGRARRGETPEKVPTGDAHFDRLFDVRATDARAVQQVLGPGVRLALQRFPMHMVGAGLALVVDGDQARVEWAGGEVDRARLGAAHAVLREVCRAAP
jgi:hypothetical protein